MKFSSFPLAIFLILITSISCNLDPSKSGSSVGGVILPNISGSAGEVLIVMDPVSWKAPSGIRLKEVLEQQYPSLPQPEPLFDIIQINPGAFDNLFKRHRTILITDISPEYSSPEIKYFENLWAKPQLVIRLNASNPEGLSELIDFSGEKLIQTIQTYDLKRLMNIYKTSKDPGIKSIVNKFNISLDIPRGYKTDIDTDNFAMFSVETPRTSQVICIYRFQYTGEPDLSTNNLVNKRDEFMKIYTRGSQTGSYMITAPMFPVMVYDIRKNGKDIIEMRGLWELNKGFMGGPFVSHSYVDSSRNMITTVEGYVYNPNEKKRNLLRQLEAILFSMEIVN